MALIYIEDNDPWIVEHDACEALFREIMEQLSQRERELRTSQTFASLSANVRFQLKQYEDKIYQLRRKNDESLKLRVITPDEADRRRRQIEQLQSNVYKIKQLYDSRMNPRASDRPSLLTSGGAFADGGTTGWGADDDDDDPPLDVNVTVTDLKAQNEAALREQDRGLDELYQVIVRQKNVAQTINGEVAHQNEIIDDLADHMERTDERLIDGTRRIRDIDRRDRTCGYWVVIVLLFASIVTVALV